jgi:23S rRNA-/tRNA-specific pseudouridylate synthase
MVRRMADEAKLLAAAVDANRKRNNDDDDELLWKNAHQVRFPLRCGKNQHDDEMIVVLQLVGLFSPTHTVFGRIVVFVSPAASVAPAVAGGTDRAKKVPTSTTMQRPITLLEMTQWMVEELQRQRNSSENNNDQNWNTYSADELLHLGAVWLLRTPHRSSHNKKNQRKQKRNNTRLFWNTARKFHYQDQDTVRVHFLPSRFPAALRRNLWSSSPKDSDGPCQEKELDHNSCNAHAATHDIIVYQNDDLGFMIVNKPSNVPSHGTVDNGVENILYQLQQHTTMIRRKKQKEEEEEVGPLDDNDDGRATKPACSLSFSVPQRLDIETSGLLLVSTRSEFASYMGKLLQHKTLHYTSSSSTSAADGTACSISKSPPKARAATGAIQKRYKCLVHLASPEDRSQLLQQLETSRGIVTHYVDAKSSAPKTFVTADEYSAATAASSRRNQNHDHEEKSSSLWLQCLLRIWKVGPCRIWRTNRSIEQEQSSYNEFLVMELDIELWTGRTHQIRGQLAAMNLPLVGDPLYTGKRTTSSSKIPSWNEVRHRIIPLSSTPKTAATEDNVTKLALQCCYLGFIRPQCCKNDKDGDDDDDEAASYKKRGRRRRQGQQRVLVESSANVYYTFQLDKAWWTDQLE